MVLNIPVISIIGYLPIKLQANKIYFTEDVIVAVSEIYVNRALSVNKKCKIEQTLYLGISLEIY